MLTIREMARSGCQIVGWVANILQPAMQLLPENLDDLQQRISWPLLATIPFAPTTQQQSSLALQLANAVIQELK